MWYQLDCPACGIRFKMEGEGNDQTSVPKVPPHGPPDDTAIDCPGGYADAINVTETEEPQRRRPLPPQL